MPREPIRRAVRISEAQYLFLPQSDDFVGGFSSVRWPKGNMLSHADSQDKQEYNAGLTLSGTNLSSSARAFIRCST